MFLLLRRKSSLKTINYLVLQYVIMSHVSGSFGPEKSCLWHVRIYMVKYFVNMRSLLVQTASHTLSQTVHPRSGSSVHTTFPITSSRTPSQSLVSGSHLKTKHQRSGQYHLLKTYQVRVTSTPLSQHTQTTAAIGLVSQKMRENYYHDQHACSTPTPPCLAVGSKKCKQ